MWRPVASGQGERDHERGDLAAISVAVSRAAEGGRLRCGASSSTSAAVRFALPMEPRSCHHCCAGFKPERHGRLRRAVETSESSGHDGRSDLAAVLEAMPDADGRYGRRRHRCAPGRLCSPSPCTGARSRAANGLSVPVATTVRASPDTRASKLWRPSPTAAGSSASAQQAQYRCPGATVVWVNEKSHIYHFPGTHDYGNTKRGEYMCEADAQAAGNRAAKNEHHP